MIYILYMYMYLFLFLYWIPFPTKIIIFYLILLQLALKICNWIKSYHKHMHKPKVLVTSIPFLVSYVQGHNCATVKAAEAKYAKE